MFIYLFLFVAVFVIAFFAYAKYGISDEDIARIKREALAKKSNNNTTSSDYSRGQEDGIDDAIHGEAPFALGGSSDYQKGYDSDASWEMHEAMHHDGLGF